MKRILLLAVLLIPTALAAQNLSGAYSYDTGTWAPVTTTGTLNPLPSGGSNPPPIALTCFSTTLNQWVYWTAAQCGSGGGGSGTVSGQAANVIPLGTSATVIGAQSHLTDASGIVASSEPFTTPKLNTVFEMKPSGDTSGATDNANLAANLAANLCTHALAGSFYFTGNISITAPPCIYGDGASLTFFYLTSATNDFLDLTYGGGGLNNESYGAEIHSFSVLPAVGVTPTAGFAFNLAGSSSSAFMSGLRIYNVDMWGLCGGIKTGSYMVSNWIVNNHFTSFTGTTGCYGIYMNTPVPGGDFHWDGNELSGAGSKVLIHQSDVQEISGLKMNLAGITFDNSADRVSIVNTSLEGGGTGASTPSCGINFTGTAANLVQISFEGKIDLMPNAFCANGVGTLNPSANTTQFSYNVNLNQTNDGLTGRVISGQALVNPLTFQIASQAPNNYCPLGNGSTYVGALCPGAGLATASTPVFSPTAGSYANTQNVSITCSTGSAYYSVGGGAVTAYSTTIAVSSTETIAAGCFGTAYSAAQASATYTIAAYQTQDLFAGTNGTLLSAHTDLDSHSWAVWPYDTTSGDTIQLSGSNYAWDIGASVTHNAAYLNSLAPSSANYTVGQTFTVVSNVSYGAQVFARASSGAATSYLMICASSVAGCQLQKLVTGTDTNIGSPSTYSFTWANNAPHTMSLYANGTALTGYIDGVAVLTATDSSISAAGQSGFGETANSNVKASNFVVQ